MQVTLSKISRGAAQNSENLCEDEETSLLSIYPEKMPPELWGSDAFSGYLCKFWGDSIIESWLGATGKSPIYLFLHREDQILGLILSFFQGRGRRQDIISTCTKSLWRFPQTFTLEEVTEGSSFGCTQCTRKYCPFFHFLVHKSAFEVQSTEDSNTVLTVLFRNAWLSYRPSYGLFSLYPVIILSCPSPIRSLQTNAMPRVAAVRKLKVR